MCPGESRFGFGVTQNEFYRKCSRRPEAASTDNCRIRTTENQASAVSENNAILANDSESSFRQFGHMLRGDLCKRDRSVYEPHALVRE
jgi:hypothetical protein